jgi:hypothetical protein
MCCAAIRGDDDIYRIERTKESGKVTAADQDIMRDASQQA